MNITMYFINWNDIEYLPFLKIHYGSFCNKIVMYDNYSTDGSVNFAKKLGFEVRTFGKKGELNDQYYLDVKNNCWKEEKHKSDYVIVCDADEFIKIPDKLTCSIPRMEGYNMVSDQMPKHSIFDINTGEPSESYSKWAIFSPSRIKDINYVHGCHVAKPVGDLSNHDTCQLYHYRQIGGVDRLIKRHEQYRERMSAFNKKHGMGFHYLHDNHSKIEEFNYLKQRAVELW